MERRRQLVADLLFIGTPLNRIGAFLRQDEPQITERQIRYVIDEVRAQWQEEYALLRPAAAAHQVQRIFNDLTKMRARDNPPWNAIIQAEKLVAEITGTLSPRRFELSPPTEFAQTLARALSSMTPEERERAIAEQRELARKASAIVVAGESSTPSGVTDASRAAVEELLSD